MKLCKPSYEIYEQGPGLEGIYEAIERAGRTCYKSVRKEGTTARDFVDRMIKSGHNSMLEHGTVYLHFIGPLFEELAIDSHDKIVQRYNENKYSIVNYVNSEDGNKRLYYVTTNFRVLVENGWLDDLKYLCEPTEYHEKRVTVRFTTDRGVSHEFVRHRVFSFAQESTRYCNYSKDKFGNELTFIIPSWCPNRDEAHIVPDKYDVDWNDELIEDFGDEQGRLYIGLVLAENAYLDLLKIGCTPQQARQVLPNALKTELVMTGFVSDWEHFFDLRARGTTGAPHPDAKALAEPLMGEFYKRNLIQ